MENLNLYEYIVDASTGFSTARNGNVNILLVLESGPFLHKLSTLVVLMNGIFNQSMFLRKIKFENCWVLQGVELKHFSILFFPDFVNAGIFV